MTDPIPEPAAIRQLAGRLERWLLRTPVARLPALDAASGARVTGKLEFLQRTSTFKPRGALSVMLALSPAERSAGVTAVSAGNHAIATAYAARELGIPAKVVMPASALALRVERCRAYGAEVVLAEDVHAAFDLADDIRSREGRSFVHPFEGPRTSLGTATLGLEICEQVGDFDAVVVPVGGGGLISGVAAAVRQLRPGVEVFGVEPEGADSLQRSLASGRPERLARVTTVADSLGAPYALPYSFELCRRYVTEVVTVSDTALQRAMAWLFRELKVAVEPACAAGTAALLGPLRERLAGRSVVVVFCGSNIDWPGFARLAWPEGSRVA